MKARKKISCREKRFKQLVHHQLEAWNHVHIVVGGGHIEVSPVEQDVVRPGRRKPVLNAQRLEALRSPNLVVALEHDPTSRLVCQAGSIHTDDQVIGHEGSCFKEG